MLVHSLVMDIDCSLEEFTKALVANGYINDDSCFPGEDLPSMLNVLESPEDILSAADSFPSSPYCNDDLSKILEMAQLGGGSLLDNNELSENTSCFVHQPLSLVVNVDLNAADGDNFDLNSVTSLNHRLDSSGTISSLLQKSRNGDPVLSNQNFNKEITATVKPVSVNIPEGNISGALDNSSRIPCSHFINSTSKNISDTCSRLCPLPSQTAPPSISAFATESTVFHPSNIDLTKSQKCYLESDLPGYLASSNESVNATDGIKSQIESQKQPQQKQKRKRRSKGFSRSAKSRKKSKSSEPQNNKIPQSKSNSKASKKNNSVKDKCESTSSSYSSSLPLSKRIDYATDINLSPDDSGFESGDKISLPQLPSSPSLSALSSYSDTPVSTPTSSTTSGAIDVSTESTSSQGQTLRRSTRATKRTETYDFRLTSLVKRVETERRQKQPRAPKGKAKPPPLSKYRRRTANARERDRMKEINDAYEKLKGTLPEIRRSDGRQKITKFTILKHALKYIASLRRILGYEPMSFMDEEDLSGASDISSPHPSSVTSSSNSDDSCSSPTSCPSITSPLAGICSVPTSSSATSMISPIPKSQTETPPDAFAGISITSSKLQRPTSLAL